MQPRVEGLCTCADLEQLYASSLSSETRRRQSTDFANQGDRSKPYSLSGGTLGNGLRRRRGDSTGTGELVD